MELHILLKYLQDLYSQGLAHSKVILNVGGCVSDLLVMQSTEKKGEPVILIGAKDDELEDLSGY